MLYLTKAKLFTDFVILFILLYINAFDVFVYGFTLGVVDAQVVLASSLHGQRVIIGVTT